MNHLYNFDFTPAAFNPKLPFWFCDVDGVLSPIPYEKEWHAPAGQTELEATIMLMNNRGYTVKRVEPDISTHFAVETELVIPFNKAGDYEDILPPNIRDVNIRFNVEVINRVRNIILSGKVNFVYLTSWNHQAITLLNPVFNFPSSTPFLRWSGNHTDYGSQYGKRNAIIDFYETLKKSGMDSLPPFIWVDDQVTVGHETVNEYGEPGHWNSLLNEQTGATDSLIIKTDTRWGLSRADLASVENFVNNH